MKHHRRAKLVAELARDVPPLHPNGILSNDHEQLRLETRLDSSSQRKKGKFSPCLAMEPGRGWPMTAGNNATFPCSRVDVQKRGARRSRRWSVQRGSCACSTPVFPVKENRCRNGRSMLRVYLRLRGRLARWVHPQFMPLAQPANSTRAPWEAFDPNITTTVGNLLASLARLFRVPWGTGQRQKNRRKRRSLPSGLQEDGEACCTWDRIVLYPLTDASACAFHLATSSSSLNTARVVAGGQPSYRTVGDLLGPGGGLPHEQSGRTRQRQAASLTRGGKRGWGPTTARLAPSRETFERQDTS